jgi:hypothetical protein
MADARIPGGRALREAAVHACRSCPALAPSTRWALESFTDTPDNCDGAAGIIVAARDRPQRQAARRGLSR